MNVSKEHFAQLTKASPLIALQEMIWNGFDAGGQSVEVRFDVDGLGQLKAIEIEDQGDGILPAHLNRTFGTVGDSLKVEQKQTSNGRLLHGEEGKGRFKALALGATATWNTCYRDNGEWYRYEITIKQQTSDHIELTEPEIATTQKVIV